LNEREALTKQEPSANKRKTELAMADHVIRERRSVSDDPEDGEIHKKGDEAGETHHENRLKGP